MEPRMLATIVLTCRLLVVEYVGVGVHSGLHSLLDVWAFG
jgi:hypothetical protein